MSKEKLEQTAEKAVRKSSLGVKKEMEERGETLLSTKSLCIDKFFKKFHQRKLFGLCINRKNLLRKK